MPLESLACTNCGSPDVREVKSNIYFCNHCDGAEKQRVTSLAKGYMTEMLLELAKLSDSPCERTKYPRRARSWRVVDNRATTVPRAASGATNRHTSNAGPRRARGRLSGPNE
jgi:hypothetical protein